MKTCKFCQSKIDDVALVCPYCQQHQVLNKAYEPTWLDALLAVVVAYVLLTLTGVL